MYKVMIVSDDPEIRRGLISMIDWKGLDCSVVSEPKDGKEAMEEIRKIQPDIVIGDIKMSGMDGIKLIKFIFESYPNSKVVVFTGYSDFYYAQAAIRYGVVDYILKPSSPEEIQEAVVKSINLIDDKASRVQNFINFENKAFSDLDSLRKKLYA